MPLTGIQLMLLIGPTVPLPAPESLAAAIDRVEVTHRDDGASGCQIVFKAGRGQPYNALDYPLLKSRLLAPFSRIVLVLRVGLLPNVLFDGMITDQQLAPGDQPGAGILTITAEDLTIMLDLEEKIVAHPAQSELVIANKIIASYARYGIAPMVIPPKVIDQPLPMDRVPIQHATDLGYLREMANRFGYDVYLTPNRLPGSSMLYWGPPKRSLPQSALSINMGPASNVTTINFRYDALAAHSVKGSLLDRQSGRAMPIVTTPPIQVPIARTPAPRKRTTLLHESGGLDVTVARARAQASVDQSSANVITADGELDGVRYGKPIEARRLIGVRGVGDTYDGLYLVRRVTHVIERGNYQQRFSLAREGVGTLTPALLP
jgi:hypothetical protein